MRGLVRVAELVSVLVFNWRSVPVPSYSVFSVSAVHWATLGIKTPPERIIAGLLWAFSKLCGNLTALPMRQSYYVAVCSRYRLGRDPSMLNLP